MFADIYKAKNVFVTGHTGFKGSWLSLWLNKLGANVTGYALAPSTSPNHWDRLDLDSHSIIGDIRDFAKLESEIQKAAPEIVFHLAAQPLVRASYADPLSTWDTNVMGTANLLGACRRCPSVRAIVVVTTDKCYENNETEHNYTESDRLGGHDPYSASKAATELLIASHRKSFLHAKDSALLASARAGNVIGGGDWSEDRLIPDLARAVCAKRDLIIRSPKSTRPWQHVLEALAGYLILGQKLLEGRAEFAAAWNFGPGPEGNRTVEDVLATIKKSWPATAWNHEHTVSNPHEAKLLQLDSTKAHTELGWTPLWDLDEGLQKTAEWYKAFIEQDNVITAQQLEEYCRLSANRSSQWAA